MIIRNKVITFLSFLILISSLIPFSGIGFVSAKSSDIPSKTLEKTISVDKGEYISAVEKNDFAFTGIASKWSNGFGNVAIFLRTGKSENTLGAWALLNPENGKDNNDWIYGEVYNSDSDQYLQYKIDFSGNDIGKNFKINFNFFNTSGQTGITKISLDNSGLGPKIISRSEWGANESWMTWKPEYDGPKAFVIHHTAGEEGAKVADQMSVVRNLYYGHAVSYGWGDIGYNYVIDVNGSIYEGRSGGGGVIAGHTLGYNSGTIGIVLIGDYNVRNLETAQYDALINLIAYKSFQYGINPTGQVYLKNKTIPTIVGHKDLNATSCPGNTIYERIQDLRGKTDTKLKTYPAKKVSAQFISVDNGAQVYGGDTTKIKASLKNTGNTPWPSGGDNKLSISGVGGSLSAELVSFGRSVEPGEIGNFNLNITAPSINQGLSQSFETRLGGNLVSGGGFSANLNVVTPEYRGKVVDKAADQILAAGKQATLWVDVKNVGSKNWTSGDAIKLVTSNNRDSLFYTDGDWESKKSPGSFNNSNISSGATGRISFVITAPNNPGQYNEKFTIRSDSRNIEGGNLLNVEWNITVNAAGGQLVTTPTPSEPKVYSQKISAYTFSLMNQSAYPTLNSGETKAVSLEVKNTGITNWYKDFFHLATIDDKESAFANSSWLSKNRIAMSQDKVAPGETARFDFTITAPTTLGLTKEKFGLVADGIGWTDDIGIFWNFMVVPSASVVNNTPVVSASDKDDFDYISQSPFISMNAGTTQQIWLEVKNTGNKIWKKDDATPVRLATANPRDRISPFISSNRVAMDKDTVNPGENVRFTFNITAPSEAKVYKEYFTLVRDGVAWFKDIGIYWQITVNPPAGGQDVNATANNSNNSTQLISIPNGVQTVKVSSNGPFIVVNDSGAKLAEGKNGDIVTAYYNGGKHFFKINNGNVIEATGWVSIVPWAVPTIFTVDSYTDRPAWNPSINDNRFKGVIEIRYSTKSHKLWVINDLNIEDYLKGVSEPLDSAGYEYVKSAVVAERSYIYYHLSRGGRWPDDFITLKNSRNGNGDDQIYQGYNFATRANNIPRAVDDTAGQVVTYNSNPVLTPYYTQSDGRTRSISEVWGSKQSDYPWLVSVPDPWSAGYPMLGHGVGMSGRGARGMANDGKSYKEILRYFYTGTDVGKINTNRNVRVGIYSIDM
ncbi:MAG: NBR1-Ig-like domain-containing protein [Patescibacteria group bacterium]|nr:NBR1-Ig-like domain-containing protein [Patescibacteria group bacterium]